MLIHLLASISSNHNRLPSFISKFEQVFNMLKDDIKKYLNNNEIYLIFKNNKRILLYLFKENIIKITDDLSLFKSNKILSKLSQQKYFYPEITEKSTEQFLESFDMPDDFEEKRNIGENDDYICEVIRKDLIEDFIIYVNKNEYSLNSTIKPSIYETNPFLLKKQNTTTLLEYASFFGSVQIFKYLIGNGAKSTSLLWIYGVHSDNPELISFFDENNIKPPSYVRCYAESIKCHHIQMANYIQSNFMKEGEEKSDIVTKAIFHSFNFDFFQESFSNPSSLYFLVKYDYFYIVENLSKNKNIEVNNLMRILNLFFFNIVFFIEFFLNGVLI